MLEKYELCKEWSLKNQMQNKGCCRLPFEYVNTNKRNTKKYKKCVKNYLTLTFVSHIYGKTYIKF